MDSTALCSLKSDPDISGIGVRVAIYIQNLISFIPATQALWDGSVSVDELDRLQTQATTILLTAFAILISAIVEAKTLGITALHAHVILSLSWMNNTNAFIYFILFAQRKSKLIKGSRDWVESTWSAWAKRAEKEFWPKYRDSDGSDREKDLLYPAPSKREVTNTSGPLSRPSKAVLIAIEYIFSRIVFILGSLHLSLMAALGIWLWSNPASFGSFKTKSPSSDSPPPCSIDELTVIILGRHFSLGSSGLRIVSILIYSPFLPLALNLFLPAVLFLSLFIHLPTSGMLSPSRIGLGILFIVNIIFIVDIELTLRQNRKYQDSSEASWTFGQILALLLLVLPLRDFIPVDTLVDRQLNRRAEEIELYMAAESGKEYEVLRLLEKGTSPDVKGGEFGSALQAASYKEHWEIVKLLLAYKADPNVRGGAYGSPLRAASSRGHTEIVKLLLDKGADPNAQGGDYGSPLQAASYRGNTETVKLLLDKGANPNTRGGDFGVPLHAASSTGHIEIVKLLLDKGANPNIQGGDYGSPLQAASSTGHLEIIKLLLDKGADLNVQACGSLLRSASYRGHTEIVKLLLNKGADPNAQGGDYSSPLQAASYRGNTEVVKLLLDKGADLNAQGGGYGSPLYAASSEGRTEIIKLLLDKGANPNIQGGGYGSPLQAASYRGHTETVRLLLDKGADPNAQGGHYGSPLQAALSIRHLTIAKLLRTHGATR